ncbi:hypothetical protein N7540_003422 [Penicillium herquei]|nr:hypothetical protein N7540_003422 [Penicillium herquei]
MDPQQVVSIPTVSSYLLRALAQKRALRNVEQEHRVKEIFNNEKGGIHNSTTKNGMGLCVWYLTKLVGVGWHESRFLSVGAVGISDGSGVRKYY